MPRAEARSRLLVFGDIIDDVVAVPAAPVQRDTDTPSAISIRPGGSAANTAAWLACEGADAAFVGRVGEADVARHDLALREAGVEPHLIADRDLPTGGIVIIVEGEARTMLTERGANVRLSPSDIAVDGFALVHATGYSLGDYAAEFAELVVRAHTVGARVSLNAGSVALIEQLGVDGFTEATKGVDILIANAAEAAMLVGDVGSAEAARLLADRHGIAAVTAGTEGAFVARRGERVAHVARVDAVAIDPTGAGDAFAAGLLAGLVAGDDLRAAAERGVRLAAQAVANVGGRPTRTAATPG